MSILKSLYRSIIRLKNGWTLYSHRRTIPEKVKKIRTKDRIIVLFVVSDLSLWKTEELYKAMQTHPRFEPIIGLTLLTCDSPSETIRKYNKLSEYLDEKGYTSIQLSSGSIENIRPDLAFYQQPYNGFIADSVNYMEVIKNGGLVCDVHYAFRSLAPSKKYCWVIDLPLYRYCWQIYLENDMNLEYKKISLLKGKNLFVTGIPWQDKLTKPREAFNDPWKPQGKNKKRIIYAPHHTLPDQDNLINLSCFLDVCDYMLEIAEIFSDSVQFAFKPHPFLKRKLVNLWGEEKANKYYRKWDELDNCQLVEDSYVDLFKHSDALIHDCDSFTVEYCFMKKPILYLIESHRIEVRRNDLNRCGKMAFDLHDKGITKEDIYSFITSVVEGVDTKKEDRDIFYETALVPPNGRSAVENIIDAIIGED